MDRDWRHVELFDADGQLRGEDEAEDVLCEGGEVYVEATLNGRMTWYLRIGKGDFGTFVLWQAIDEAMAPHLALRLAVKKCNEELDALIAELSEERERPAEPKGE